MEYVLNKQSAFEECQLCPRCCGVNRSAGELGYCRAGSTAEIFRYGPHHGEEPPISGSRGSGAVFFSRCTLNCLYCQNFPFSQDGKGECHDIKQLSGIFRSLRDNGCHNWNLVSPTPWLPMIREAWKIVKSDGVLIPVVYNTSGFERVETLREFGKLVDIYLVDLRYANRELAIEGSNASGYVEHARDALKEMWHQTGPLKCDENGVAVSGTICRLLILPNRADEVVENLEWLAETIGTDIAISVLAQYLPAYKAVGTETWDRRINSTEYEKVRSAVRRLGFSNGWVQEFGGVTSRELIGFQMKAANE